MKPERRTFMIDSGALVESTVGKVRECFLVEVGVEITMLRLWQNLRQDHGTEVQLGRNLASDLTYIVSMRADGHFTEDQFWKISKDYKSILRTIVDEDRGQVIKGPWSS